jgi:aspartyl-tRNA(Asn)/glutamyl-tRNA(Gln) amidotransferase subunit C
MTERNSKAGESVDVAYVARLARMALTPEETAQFQRQLEDVLAYVGQLAQLDLEGVEPTAHAVPVRNVFREDAARPGLSPEAALANAPAARQGLFIVPKIVE